MSDTNFLELFSLALEEALTEREQSFVELRYGILSEEPHTSFLDGLLNHHSCQQTHLELTALYFKKRKSSINAVKYGKERGIVLI